MSLREELERRRTQPANGTAPISNNISSEHADAAQPSTAAVSPPPFLRLVKLNKQCWLLPWACFHGISYEPAVLNGDETGKCERLHIIFMRHEVTVGGHNLIAIVDAIEKANLHVIREVAEKYQPLGEHIAGNAAIVCKVDVMLR